MEYQTCGWEISCDDLSTVSSCSDLDCSSGCFCTENIVLDDGVCIIPDTCPSKWHLMLLLGSLFSIKHAVCFYTIETGK